MGTVALRRRSDRRIAAMVTALVILAAAVLGVWVAVTLAFTDTELPAVEDAAGQSWDSPWVIGIGAVLVLLGLVLIGLALKPGPSWFSDLRAGERPQVPQDRMRTVVTTQGLRRLAAAEAARVDGVFEPKVQATSKRILVHAMTLSPDPGATSREVETNIRQRLEEMSPSKAPQVVARLRRRKEG
ncbi:DUF6286 domain-containing protein [Nesterenkonia aerolata]|uniref:DUF6286 domain-containing protein n=1 Tax=Nesterenkonia aerolata TaxID=3074079 RepID=A0ABU2DP13_9MICC|nr:DUF6286 domain-containing protein [Nesterenkonia sp. LY-0111]MDR8018055.1 DUF6286 domain-containing protein [Nesterenkonia sp. LY-0111]